MLLRAPSIARLLDPKEGGAQLRGDAAGAAGGGVDEGPVGLGAHDEASGGRGDGLGRKETIARRGGGGLVGSEAVDLVSAEGAGAVEVDGPGDDAKPIADGGGAEVVDLVAAGDEETAEFAEARDIVAGGGGVVDGGLFEVVEIGGVVDVAEGIELVVADAEMGEVGVGGAG